MQESSSRGVVINFSGGLIETPKGLVQGETLLPIELLDSYNLAEQSVILPIHYYLSYDVGSRILTFHSGITDKPSFRFPEDEVVQVEYLDSGRVVYRKAKAD